MKYKVGDKVRVRKDLDFDIIYGDYRVSKHMMNLRGVECTIEGVYHNFYYLKESDYRWSDEMLEPVEDKESSLLNFALEKLGITKEELEKELYNKEEKVLLTNTILEYHEKFKEYCHNTFCSEEECKIRKFQNDNNCRDMSCGAVFMAMEILKDSKEFFKKNS